jgi:hypothetical protein
MAGVLSWSIYSFTSQSRCHQDKYIYNVDQFDSRWNEALQNKAAVRAHESNVDNLDIACIWFIFIEDRLHKEAAFLSYARPRHS